MFSQEAGKIVGHDRSRLDVAVEAALPFAALQDVPQSQAGRGQLLQAFSVGQHRVRAEEFAEDRPEQIARMGVVFARR